MSSALVLASLSTFITGFGYFGNTKQVMFISGGQLSRDLLALSRQDRNDPDVRTCRRESD